MPHLISFRDGETFINEKHVWPARTLDSLWGRSNAIKGKLTNTIVCCVPVGDIPIHSKTAMSTGWKYGTTMSRQQSDKMALKREPTRRIGYFIQQLCL